MLLSHRCKFIYLKTRKTAGTSLEIYFEPYCTDPEGVFSESESRASAVSSWGIVGSRRRAADSVWYNHMPAQEVRDLVGPEIWCNYFKFCVVRNPFDKVVSYFWHETTDKTRAQLQAADFEVVRRTFSAWTELKYFPVDRRIYMLGGEPAVDFFLRFEQLGSDVSTLCDRLGVPWRPNRFGRYKADLRKRPEPFEAYYTAEAEARVAEAFAWELEYFHYPRLVSS